MREGKPLIVGMDPGTTTGIAVFDLSGNLILVKSGKNMSRADIATVISSAGNPIIVSSDIKPIPRAVEKIAISFSARLIEPAETFSRKEKHETAKEYMRLHGHVWKNRHERDALVSGIYAYKRVRQLVDRINSRFRKTRVSDPGLRNMIITEVLLQKRSIDHVMKKHGFST
jgi:predicted RNase H-like nuclease (RuvC/YqgF family)